jgi:hypothetical protein
LLQQIFIGWHWRPWITLTGGLIWSIPLSVLKLSGAIVLVSDYPRTYISRLLLNDHLTIISYLFRALFAPETLPSVIVTNQSILPPYEFEFGVSVIPAFLIVAATIFSLKQLRRPRHPFIVGMLALIIVIPFFVTVGSEAWGRISDARSNNKQQRISNKVVLHLYLATNSLFSHFLLTI